MMRKRKTIMSVILSLVIGSLALLACGDLKGPGSDNAEESGGILYVTKITPQDRGQETYNIDVIQDTVPCEEEALTDATMTVTLSYVSAESCANQHCPNIQILSYRVEYTSNDAGAVLLDPLEVVTQNIYIEPDQLITLDGLLLMPVDKKKEFLNKGGDYSAEPQYQVKVTFYGVNDYGVDVKSFGETYILVADWLTCSA